MFFGVHFRSAEVYIACGGVFAKYHYLIFRKLFIFIRKLVVVVKRYRSKKHSVGITIACRHYLIAVFCTNSAERYEIHLVHIVDFKVVLFSNFIDILFNVGGKVIA